MRCLLLLGAALLAGCGKRAEPTEAPAGPATERVAAKGDAPGRATDLRADMDDVYDHYARGKGPHPHEGKRVVLRVRLDECGEVKGHSGLLVWGGDRGLKRPKAAFASGRWSTHQVKNETYIYFNGVLKGPTPLAAFPWADKASALTPHHRMPDHVILIEDMGLVPDPSR